MPQKENCHGVKRKKNNASGNAPIKSGFTRVSQKGATKNIGHQQTQLAPEESEQPKNDAQSPIAGTYENIS